MNGSRDGAFVQPGDVWPVQLATDGADPAEFAEQDVSVNGIVSGAYPSVIEEVTKPTADESLMMNIVAFPREDS